MIMINMIFIKIRMVRDFWATLYIKLFNVHLNLAYQNNPGARTDFHYNQVKKHMFAVGGLVIGLSDCEVIGPGSIPGRPSSLRQGTLPLTVSRLCLVKNTRNFQVIDSRQEGHPAVKF